MSDPSIAILGTGLVTSVSLSAPAACAAIRAKVSNATETRFIDSDGEWIMAHQGPPEKPWRGGRAKLARMATMAIEECLNGIPREEWSGIPLLLCVAERNRPGRLEKLDDQLLLDVECELNTRLDFESGVVARGRVSVFAALTTRKSLRSGTSSRVVTAASDSSLNWCTLSAYERDDRLLTRTNSNGFMPGEEAGALLVGMPGRSAELVCIWIGFGTEKAHVDSSEPLRADGLTTAIRNALADAMLGMGHLDDRITDLSGEQNYFKEAALALGRLLRQRKEEFNLWHPAECVAECGAAVGTVEIAQAASACRKGSAPGHTVLANASNDAGFRAAAVLRYEVRNGE